MLYLLAFILRPLLRAIDLICLNSRLSDDHRFYIVPIILSIQFLLIRAPLRLTKIPKAPREVTHTTYSVISMVIGVMEGGIAVWTMAGVGSLVQPLKREKRSPDEPGLRFS